MNIGMTADCPEFVYRLPFAHKKNDREQFTLDKIVSSAMFSSLYISDATEPQLRKVSLNEIQIKTG